MKKRWKATSLFSLMILCPALECSAEEAPKGNPVTSHQDNNGNGKEQNGNQNAAAEKNGSKEANGNGKDQNGNGKNGADKNGSKEANGNGKGKEQNGNDKNGSKEANGNGKEEEHSAHTFSGNLTLATDYRYRGISQTMRRPTVQGTLEYAHESGFFLGTFASNTDGTCNFINNTSFEIDFYGGLKGKLFPCRIPDLEFNIGAIYFYYPGGKVPIKHTVYYDTGEWNIQLSYKWFSVRYSQTINNYYGICSRNPPFNWKTDTFDRPNGNSVGSPYIEINLTFELWEKKKVRCYEIGKMILALHAGYQGVRHYSNLNYADWLVTLSQEFPWFTLAVSYVGTNAKAAYYDIPDKAFHPSIRRLGAQACVAYLIKTF